MPAMLGAIFMQQTRDIAANDHSIVTVADQAACWVWRRASLRMIRKGTANETLTPDQFRLQIVPTVRPRIFIGVSIVVFGKHPLCAMWFASTKT